MATNEITLENFAEKTSAPGIVLLDWHAEWCGPCKRFGPIFEDASEKHPDLVFGKIDTEEQRELSTSSGIVSIPTLMAYRDGILMHSKAGALSAMDLEKLIMDIRAIDMDAVRSRIARETAAKESAAREAAEKVAAARVLTDSGSTVTIRF